jgi:ATP synthase protein I
MSDSGANDGNKSGRGEISPEDRAAFRRRASDLSKQLDHVKARYQPKPEHERARGQAMGQAMKIAIELVAGVAVGGFIGWFLDKQLGTQPWLMVLFIVLGFCAGMLNVIRTAQRLQAKVEPLQRSAPSIEDGGKDK